METEHREQLFATIQQTGLAIEHFNFQSGAEENERIYLEYLENSKPTGLKFNLKSLPDSSDKFKCRHTLYCPTMKYSNWYPVPANEYDSIDDVCSRLSCWIEYTLKEYISDQFEVDLWEEYKKA